MAEKYMVSLKDIAKETGYSVSTVSRVIKSKGEISEETREKITQVAERLGYYNNRLSSAMMTGKTGIIGVISSLGNSFFSKLLSSITEELMKADYLPLLTSNDVNLLSERECMKLLLERRVEGIIFIPTHDTGDDEYFAEITKRGLPLVAVDRKIPAHMDFVGTDDFAGGYMAAEHLYQLGHRKLGHFQGFINSSVAQLRCKGFMDFCNSHPDCSGVVIGKGDWRFESIDELTEQIKNHHDITAYSAFSDSYAGTLISAFNKMGVRIPGDVSVIGFGNVENRYMMTSLDQNPKELGRLAVQTLMSRIENSDVSYADIRLKPQLILRNTTCKI